MPLTIPLTTASPPTRTPLGTATCGTKPVRPIGRPSLKRSIFTLAMGQAGATAMAVTLSPILTRLYSPETFGLATLLTSLVTVLGVFGTWSYYRALPLTNSLPQRRGLFALSLVIAAGMTVVLAVIVAFFGESVAGAFGAAELIRYLPVLPLLFLATAVGSLITMGLNCERRFGTVAARTMIEKTGTVTSQIALGATVLPNAPFGLLLGALFGHVGGALWGIGGVYRGLFRGLTYTLHPQVLLALAYKYRRLPGVYTWSNLLGAVGISAPVVVMGALFPLSVVGLYGLSYRILKLPTHLFTVASSQVYYVEAAGHISRGRPATAPTMELVRILAMLTALPIAVLFLLGPLLFATVFGAPWREAGVYAQILAPWVALTTLGTPICALLPAQQRFGEALGVTTTLLIARVGGVVLGAWMFGPRGAIAVFSLANLLVWGGVFVRVLALAQVSRRMVLLQAGLIYGRACAVLLPASIAWWYFDKAPAALALTFLGSAVYAGFALRQRCAA